MDNFIFLAVDGDSAGQLVGRAVLANDVEALHDASNRINHGQDIIGDWAKANGGMLISAGGDEGNVGVPPEALHNVEQLRADYQYGTQLTLTVGVGNSLSEAGKALMVGKLRGKNQVCQYDAQVEQEYKAAEQAANDGTATGEGKKLGDAYMKQTQKAEDSHADCQYCQELTSANLQDEDHCQYCHDQVDDEMNKPHCEYCAMAEQAAAHDPTAADHAADCQYCQAAEQTMDHDHTEDCQYCASAAAPADHDHTGDDCQYCTNPGRRDAEQDSDGRPEGTPDLSAQTPGAVQTQVPAIAQVPQEVVPTAAQTAGAPVNDQGMAAVAQEIEQTTTPGETPDQVLAALDGPADMPGTVMQDNVSHPDNFQTDVPSDMGMAEDNATAQPDLQEVLNGGLDAHAQTINREKVINMVSEALQGFKASKEILERAKESAPQLHQSSIAMLKAMIEMAKMLGLSPQQQQPAPTEPNSNPQNPQSNPQQPASGAPPEGKMQGR